MAKTTFGAELRRMMDERGVSIRELTRRLYGDTDNRTQVNRWLAIDTPDQAKGKSIEAASLQRVVEALGLPYVDQVYLYGLAGLLPAMAIPGEAEIKERLSEYIPRMEAHPFPAYVLDVPNYRFWMANSGVITMIGGMARARQLINMSVFQILFDRKRGISSHLSDEALYKVRYSQISRYKTWNIRRRHEPFFMAYPERLRDLDGLTEEEYGEFEAMWNEISPTDVSLVSFAELEFGLSDSSLQVFAVKPEPLLPLQELFAISWYDVPDPQLREQALAFFAQTDSPRSVCLWELDDAIWRQRMEMWHGIRSQE
jgi:hypothetical protein